MAKEPKVAKCEKGDVPFTIQSFFDLHWLMSPAALLADGDLYSILLFEFESIWNVHTSDL